MTTARGDGPSESPLFTSGYVDGSGVSLATQAYYAIRDLIITLEIPPGSPLYEDRLCAVLGFGRTPVREAIKRLETERLVVVYPRRGTFATEINIRDHTLLAEVRRPLEGLAAERAAERATPSQVDDIVRLRKEIQSSTARQAKFEDRELLQLDRRTHLVIYRCAHNKYLENSLTQYYNLARRLWGVFLPDINVSGHLRSHIRLLQAIVSGDALEAQRLAYAHVDAFERAVFRSETDRLLRAGRRATTECGAAPSSREMGKGKA